MPDSTDLTVPTDPSEPQTKPRRRIANPITLMWAALAALTDDVAGPTVVLTPATQPEIDAALAKPVVFELPPVPPGPLGPPRLDVPAAFRPEDARRRTMGWKTDIQRPVGEDEAVRARRKREKAARRRQRRG